MASIIIAILALCVIITVHEIGHFSAAKLFNMKVPEFNLGMGPILLKKKKGETQYALRLFPIGGSVQLGEDEETDDDPRSFRNKPVWQRMIVISAGAILNLVLGLIICVIVTATAEATGTNVIGRFDADSVSSEQLQTGDKIISINGMRIFTLMDIDFQMINTESKETEGDYAVFEFVVERGGEKIKLADVHFAAQENENGGKTFRRDFRVNRMDKTVGNVIKYSAGSLISQARIIWISLFDIIRGTYGLNDMAGPVGLVSVIGETQKLDIPFSQRVQTMLSLMSFITINLGMFNLLPLPALDGGRLVFFVIELIRRKPVKAEVEGMIHFVGLMALFLLMAVVTFNDVRKLIFGA